MKTIEFIVPGVAVGKGSPRYRVVRPGKKNQFVQVYYDGKTKEWMERVALFARKHAPPEPWDCAIELTITVNVQVPQSWSATKTSHALRGIIRPTPMPDADNISKGVCDPLNKLIWRDDSRIVDLHVHKFYADEPSTHVLIRALDNTQTQIGLEL
jgi:Holliday junction resolvase RusA-like endonuclease